MFLTIVQSSMHIAQPMPDSSIVSARGVIHDMIGEFNVDSKARPSSRPICDVTARTRQLLSIYTRASYHRRQSMDDGQPSYKLDPEKTELLWSGSRYTLCKLGKEVVGQLSTSALTPSRLAVIYDSLELSCHLM